MGRHAIIGMAGQRLVAEATVRTDGCQPYQGLAELPHRQESVITGSGKNAVTLFPGVHTLIANVKGNIREFTMASVKNIFPVIWPSFANGFTDDSRKTRCLTGCSLLVGALKPLPFRG